ncbi:hypothetical protein RCL_jg19042.t1 [Rhizophagus clarus]|uniref:Uncharacterized protein n=1 Tax=Rhizophagus clarus TaxID=94130 RepID=A0A8H3LYS9_9GLOM|nr:hypothetical protein RCL_jg19042.t1 [Rhizophagus clarus]
MLVIYCSLSERLNQLMQINKKNKYEYEQDEEKYPIAIAEWLSAPLPIILFLVIHIKISLRSNCAQSKYSLYQLLPKQKKAKLSLL